MLLTRPISLLRSGSLRRFEKLSPLACTDAWWGAMHVFHHLLVAAPPALPHSCLPLFLRLLLLRSASQIRGIPVLRLRQAAENLHASVLGPLGFTFMEALRSCRAVQWQSEGQPVSRNKECRCYIMSRRQITGPSSYLLFSLLLFLAAAHDRFPPSLLPYVSLSPDAIAIPLPRRNRLSENLSSIFIHIYIYIYLSSNGLDKFSIG